MKTSIEIIKDLKNAKSNNQFDLATKAAAAFLLNTSNNDTDKTEIRVILKKIATDLINDSKRLAEETDDIIRESQAARLVTLEVGGKKYHSNEWLTYSTYCKKFNLNSTVVVTNWIKRGIVPSENLLHIREMNLKLIKAVPYKS